MRIDKNKWYYLYQSVDHNDLKENKINGTTYNDFNKKSYNMKV